MTNLTPESQVPTAPEADSFVLSPDDAKSRLENLGYTPDTWDTMMQDTTGSHFTRSLVTIAKGEEARDINDVYHDLYPDTEKAHATPDDEAASSHADLAEVQGKWEAFMRK